MTKYSIEEKKQAVDLVKQGLSLGEAGRQTGISPQVIRNFMRQTDRHGLSSLQEHTRSTILIYSPLKPLHTM